MAIRKLSKTILLKWVATSVIILVNLLLLVQPCDLAYNVAQQRDVLLGRYTVDQTVKLIILVPVSLLVVKAIWSSKKKKKNAREKRENLFKIIALSASIVFSILILDVFLRLVQHRRYIGNRTYYNRVPNKVDHGINRDIPPTAFSYPLTPPGYPDIKYTLTIDKRGFRNSTDLEKYDVLTLGDSFTEGSHVSDEQVWPVLFAKKNNYTVYNLGMSGGSPFTYLETLKKFGLQMAPKMVICMLYEGNDFRSSSFVPKKNRQRWSLETLYRSSPLRLSVKRALIRCLGPIGNNRQNVKAVKNNDAELCPPSHPLWAVSWLPLAVPEGPDAKYYTFKVKGLLDHFLSKDDLLHSASSQALFDILHEMNQ